MVTKLLSKGSELLANPALTWGLRILILALSLLAAAFMNTGVALAEPGWGGVGG